MCDAGTKLLEASFTFRELLLGKELMVKPHVLLEPACFLSPFSLALSVPWLLISLSQS